LLIKSNNATKVKSTTYYDINEAMNCSQTIPFYSGNIRV
jgi:hypothetical protein